MKPEDMCQTHVIQGKYIRRQIRQAGGCQQPPDAMTGSDGSMAEEGNSGRGMVTRKSIQDVQDTGR